MTLENDANDVKARAAGFEVVDHPKGRQHDHSRYVKGNKWIWRLREGWQTCILEKMFREHREYQTLDEALKRWDD